MSAGSGLARLNALPPEAAEAELEEVCGAPGWAKAVAAARPFADSRALVTAAEAAWDALTPEQWITGFARHPRIGEVRRVTGEPASSWSRGEQSGVEGAGNSVRSGLAETQRAYERRFGWTYIVCATGRTAEEIEADCRARMSNDPSAEIAIAAGEERRIGLLRLEKLLAKGGHR